MALYPENRPEGAFQGLSLCSGVGGLELGLHIAEPEYRTLCYVEREAFAASTLVARMEDKVLDHAPVWSDVKTFDGKPWRNKIHILSAGYPCQPFSNAGRRKGEDDPRHLWPDIARIIVECAPEWVFCENVEGHLDRGFDTVALELQNMGFTVKAGLFSAAEVGASHLRRRLFILAHANRFSVRVQGGNPHLLGERNEVCIGKRPGRKTISSHPCRSHLGDFMGNSKGTWLCSGQDQSVPLFAPTPCDFKAWDRVLEGRLDLQPQFFGLDHGMANRVDRTRSAGNGVVSLVAAYAFRTLRAAFN